MLGLCPFHKEKTPSFNVVEDKGFYHCFGCGAHGTAIDFVMQIEGLAFAEALERLADLTGIAAPRRGAALARPEPGQRLTPPMPPRRLGSRPSSRGGGPGGDGLSGAARRSTGRPCAAFELGYAPNERQALRRALVAQGFSDRETAGGRRAGQERRAAASLRPLPPPADVPDRRRARPDRRLRRPGARRRARQIPEHAGDRALPQGRAALQPAPGGQGRRASSARWCWPKATWT